MAMDEDGDDKDDGYPETVIIMKITVAIMTAIMTTATTFPERLHGSVPVLGTLRTLPPSITIILSDKD